MKNKNQAILQAVTKLKKSKYGNGVTAIKVELEAQFDRGIGDDDCRENHVCAECGGSWENYQECAECDGHGYYCEIEGEFVNCAEYSPGALECGYCLGYGQRNCSNCEEGYVECDGDCGDDDAFSSEVFCHDWLMEKLSHLGLAENREGELFHLAHGGVTNWHPAGAMKYAEFYRDGSVDSEFTFTLLLNKRTNIFLLPKVIEIWNELGEAIGNDISIDGAGMHMALLCTRNGKYPTIDWQDINQQLRFNNFRKSMLLLLPALYCLGASTETSRRLEYRRPRIEIDSHRAAIDWRSGALEFRIFDTCYHNPEHILDNVVVIANCLKYWNNRYIPTGVEKIARSIRFGNDAGDKLERFYSRFEHIDLLNFGLRKLKPSYYTLTEIKQQRKLTVNKRVISTKLRSFRKQAEDEYSEYVERFNWSLLATKHRQIARIMENSSGVRPIEEVETEAEAQVKAMEEDRQTLPVYIEQRLNKYQTPEGEYTLCAE